MTVMWIQSLCWEDPLEKEVATHCSIIAWEIPWTEEPGELVHELKKEWDLTEQLNNSGKIHFLLKYIRQLILYNYIFILLSSLFILVA